MIKTDVLIVGGSLVGLSAAIVPRPGMAFRPCRSSVTAERRSIRAPGTFTCAPWRCCARSALKAGVRAASEAQFDPDGGINAVELLAGKEIATYIANLNEGVAAISPSTRLFMTQQSLEPLIRAHAEELGAAIRYATELVSFEQDADGVTANVAMWSAARPTRSARNTWSRPTATAARSARGLASAPAGHGLLANCITIYFHADCGVALRGRNLGVIYVFNPTSAGSSGWCKTGRFRLPCSHDARATCRCPDASKSPTTSQRNAASALRPFGNRHAGRQRRDRRHRDLARGR